MININGSKDVSCKAQSFTQIINKVDNPKMN